MREGGTEASLPSQEDADGLPSLVGEESAGLEEEDDGVDDLGDGHRVETDGQVDFLAGGLLELDVDPGEALDLALLGSLKETLSVMGLAVGERRVDVDEEEGSARGTPSSLDDRPSSSARLGVGSRRGGNDGSTGSSELSLNEMGREASVSGRTFAM